MVQRDLVGATLALLCTALGLAACGSSGSGSGDDTNPSGGTSNGGASSLAGASASAGSSSSGVSGASSTGGSGVGAGASGALANGGAGGTSPSAGAAGTVPSGGAAGAGGKEVACNFASGLNIAWVNFANDVPNPNIATFQTIFKNTHDAGGRVVRWWFHTNGTVTPGYGSDGKALPIQQSHIDGVKAILAAAHAAGIGLNISLWSFDMLQANAGNAHTNNLALLENDANRQAYIDGYLTPLVTALKGTPGLYSYEIFNEPEGMGPNGWATYRTTEAFIQKTVNWFAAAIHAADPNVLVTNGAVTFDYCSKISGKTNYYSDDQLRTVGGKQGGVLDFYEVHYYSANGSSNSAFLHPASYWGLDKKLVMGEFAAAATDGVAQNDLAKYLYENGYNGGWAWAYDSDWPWPAEQGPLQTLYSAHLDVDNCPVSP
ncbi:MAG TPA: cellulase family glycosylhydrolase [Polyangiaceae bacterium]|nr:cellulase family glycosylhydrolase [Polyangiaceae bacterium]